MRYKSASLSLILIIMFIFIFTACTPSKTTTPREKLPDTVEYKMATIDNGYIDKSDTIINSYKILLDSLEKKTINTRIDISDITVTAQGLLKERGINRSLLNILKDFDTSIPEGLTGMKLEEVASLYMVLMTQ